MGENEAIYVAVSQDVRESKSTLLWTLKTLSFRKVFLLHVHLPFSLTTSCGFDENEINAIKEAELRTSLNNLCKYRDICITKGVNEEDVDISMTSGYDVGKGIEELIYQNNIKKLVMGAAADPHFSRGMSVTSRKAEYVSQHAPTSCKIWFICKGKLIKTRQGSLDHGNQADPFSESESESESNESSPSTIPPSHFICPISKDIMRDPYDAGDGFTYELENIRRWLNEKQTSPMTRARLTNHTLTPNHTLRLLINEWLHQHPNYNDY